MKVEVNPMMVVSSSNCLGIDGGDDLIPFSEPEFEGDTGVRET